ncbi:MAG: SDR family NAD(P)-dependent oxidoreductase [Bacteroidota bacterium]
MKTVLITGGSSGLGYGISRHFARAGFQILWVSLHQEELDTAAKKLEAEFPALVLHSLAKDLSQDGAAQAVKAWTDQQGWQVDVLINNAGFGNYGYVEEIPLDREMGLMKLNMLNLYAMSRIYLQEMKGRDQGTIINISSNSSFQPVPMMNTYASSKAFVTHFSRGLSEELRLAGSKVKVLTVCPAAIADTPFKTVNQMEKVKTFSGMAYTTVEEVSKDVWRAYRKGKSFQVSGAKMRALFFIKDLVPYRLQQWMVQREIKLS